MKCPICGHEVTQNKCTRFPICGYSVINKGLSNYKDYILFDIETTGFNRKDDRIIEIGAVKVRNGEIIETFSELCNPGVNDNGNKIYLSPKIIEVTGITEEMISNKRSEVEVVKDFIDFIEDYDILAGHNIIGFDIPFLKNAAKRANTKLNCTKAIDTLKVAKQMKLVESGMILNNKQQTLAEFYGITYHAHRAYDDAKACFEILSHMQKKTTIVPDEVNRK